MTELTRVKIDTFTYPYASGDVTVKRLMVMNPKGTSKRGWEGRFDSVAITVEGNVVGYVETGEFDIKGYKEVENILYLEVSR